MVNLTPSDSCIMCGIKSVTARYITVVSRATGNSVTTISLIVSLAKRNDAARLTTNYRSLKTIYSQRKNHRLPEWREFCEWIETLPYSEFITGIEPNEPSPYEIF